MSRTAVNRTVLAVAGLVLLALGVLVLLGGLDVYGRLGVTVPDWWPWTSPDQPVLSEASRTRWTDESWWWPVAIAVPAVVVAGCLWWLFAQARRSGPAGIDLPSPAGPRGHFALHVRSRAIEDAVERATVALPDVARVRVRVAGRPHRPYLRAAVRMESGGGAADLLARYYTGPLEGARTSLGLAALPSEFRLRVTGRRTSAGRDHHVRVH
ncbi:alkaline shock response membrane anchor protein AmaP [Kitasatospora sp. NPDC048365]|uniref:alkaline shock response membrane anchor protein AmaP n=1 Tax=Kitasatospora sp. NPDC048365 TaxID=3364050 RepID=UPI003722D054